MKNKKRERERKKSIATNIIYIINVIRKYFGKIASYVEHRVKIDNLYLHCYFKIEWCRFDIFFLIFAVFISVAFT